MLKLVQAPKLHHRILGLCFACVCRGALYIQRNEHVSMCVVMNHMCRNVVVYICILPLVVSVATLVWQITSAGLVAAWSSALWYELWVITDSTAHWECYLQEVPMRLLFKPSKVLMSGQQIHMSIIQRRQIHNLKGVLMYLQVATYQNHNMEFNFIHLTNERMKASTNIYPKN